MDVLAKDVCFIENGFGDGMLYNKDGSACWQLPACIKKEDIIQGFPHYIIKREALDKNEIRKWF